jgi:hypothetical protein
MKSVTASPTQEALAGLVELRTKARGHRDLMTVVGHSATIARSTTATLALWRISTSDAAELAARFDGHLVTCGCGELDMLVPA